MPEGDTIFMTAARLRTLLPGRVIDAAQFRDAPDMAERVVGQTTGGVEARGKHLLIHLSNGTAIHTHLGMHGAWHLYRTDQTWTKPTDWAAVVLTTGEYLAVCFHPKTLEVLSSERFRRHPYLHRLGPDLLGPELQWEKVLFRFRQHNARSIGEVVMDQTVVCGIGNVYKSEVLFLEGVDPRQRVAQLADGKILQIVERACRLMRANVDGVPRRTRSDRGSRLWVYGRSGQSCLKCGEKIKVTRQGDLGRTTYWCPSCQSTSPALEH